MADWVKIACVADCPPGSALEAVAKGRMIAVYNVAGQWYALDGVCPHQGGPLGKGSLCGPVVTCPWHGWQFDVRTGRSQISPNLVQPTVPVRVEGDGVWVWLGAGPPPEGPPTVVPDPSGSDGSP